jgi:hypothetical protein
LFDGIVLFLVIIGVLIHPIVSIPRVRGVTSSKSTSVTSHPMIPAWIAAHRATASSGLIHAFGFLPKNVSTFDTTRGILVDPHTSST